MMTDKIFNTLAHLEKHGARPHIKSITLRKEVIDELKQRCTVPDPEIAKKSLLMGIPFSQSDYMPDGVIGMVTMNDGGFIMIVTEEWAERQRKAQEAAAVQQAMREKDEAAPTIN